MFLPCLSLIPTTIVRVVPKGTIPLTALAQGPLPCWISIQQSTLSPKHLTYIFKIRSKRRIKILRIIWTRNPKGVELWWNKSWWSAGSKMAALGSFVQISPKFFEFMKFVFLFRGSVHQLDWFNCFSNNEVFCPNFLWQDFF